MNWSHNWIIRLCIQACMHRVTYYFFFFDFFSTFCVAYWRYPWKKMSPHWPCDTFLVVCQAICETFRPAHNGMKQILNEHFISINLYSYQIIVLIIDFFASFCFRNGNAKFSGIKLVGNPEPHSTWKQYFGIWSFLMHKKCWLVLFACVMHLCY